MKSMRPPSVAIFFMTYFHRARGGHGPLSPPLDPLLVVGVQGVGWVQGLFEIKDDNIKFVLATILMYLWN